MAVFSVYLPPSHYIGSNSDGFRVVPDAKATWALVFPPAWLAVKGLWLELLAWAVFIIAIILLGIWQPNPLIGYLSAIPGFYLLLEGNELIARKLERGGWQYAGTVEGENREEAEMRYIHGSRERDVRQSGNFPAPAPVAKPDNKAGFLPPKAAGLFPE